MVASCKKGKKGKELKKNNKQLNNRQQHQFSSTSAPALAADSEGDNSSRGGHCWC